MKPVKSNLNQAGLEELTHQQMIETDGGLIWKAAVAAYKVWRATQLSSNAKVAAVGVGGAAGVGGATIALTNDD